MKVTSPATSVLDQVRTWPGVSTQPTPRGSTAIVFEGHELEEPSASIAHARVCEGRGRHCYGHPYSSTKPETVDTRQGEADGCDRSSPTRKH